MKIDNKFNKDKEIKRLEKMLEIYKTQGGNFGIYVKDNELEYYIENPTFNYFENGTALKHDLRVDFTDLIEICPYENVTEFILEEIEVIISSI